MHFSKHGFSWKKSSKWKCKWTKRQLGRYDLYMTQTGLASYVNLSIFTSRNDVMMVAVRKLDPFRLWQMAIKTPVKPGPDWIRRSTVRWSSPIKSWNDVTMCRGAIPDRVFPICGTRGFWIFLVRQHKTNGCFFFRPPKNGVSLQLDAVNDIATGNGNVFGTHFFVKSCFRLEQIATAICIFDRWKGKEINTDGFLGSICRCLKQMDDEDSDLKDSIGDLRCIYGCDTSTSSTLNIEQKLVATNKWPEMHLHRLLVLANSLVSELMRFCVSRCMVVQNLGQRKTTLGRVLIHLWIWSSIWNLDNPEREMSFGTQS